MLEIDGPLTTATQVTSARTSGAGTLRLNGQMSGDSTFAVNSGRVEGAPGLFGSPAMNLANTTLRFTESGTFTGSIVHETADTTGVGVEVGEGQAVYATGALNNNSALQKLGPGKVVFCRTGTKASVTNMVGKTDKSSTTVPYSHGTNGDVPNGPPLGIYAGTIAFDGDNNTKYTVDGAVWVGFHPIADGVGGAYDANLDVYGGTLTVGSITINRLVNANYDAVDKLGLTRSPRSSINVYGGTLRVTGGFIMGYPNYVSSCISELNILGGLMEVLGTANTSSFGIGYHDSNIAATAEELSSVINITGDGILRKVGTTTLCFGGYGGSRTYLHNITLNMTGGRFEAAEANLDLMNKNAKVHVNLCGGVLDVKSLTQTRSINSYGSSMDFHFSGGTYRPNAAESSFPVKTMTSFTVGEGGAKFDLCETNKLTLAQALTTASGVADDGGIELTAETAAALLTLNVANAFNGPLTVNGGTIRPTVAAAASCAAGVIVNDGGVFDANGIDFTFGYLRGNGGVYTNGTVTVTGAVEPVSGAVFVQDLVFGSGATLRCPISGSAESGWSAPCLKVSGSVTAQGGVTLDLGGTESSPLQKGARVKVAEVAGGGSFPSLRVTGTCERTATFALRRTVGASGETEVWVEVVSLGMALHLR